MGEIPDSQKEIRDVHSEGGLAVQLQKLFLAYSLAPALLCLTLPSLAAYYCWLAEQTVLEVLLVPGRRCYSIDGALQLQLKAFWN